MSGPATLVRNARTTHLNRQSRHKSMAPLLATWQAPSGVCHLNLHVGVSMSRSSSIFARGGTLTGIAHCSGEAGLATAISPTWQGVQVKW